MTQRAEIAALRQEVALLRAEVETLRAHPVVHHHHHYPPTPVPAPATFPPFPIGDPIGSPNICGGGGSVMQQDRKPALAVNARLA